MRAASAFSSRRAARSAAAISASAAFSIFFASSLARSRRRCPFRRRIALRRPLASLDFLRQVRKLRFYFTSSAVRLLRAPVRLLQFSVEISSAFARKHRAAIFHGEIHDRAKHDREIQPSEHPTGRRISRRMLLLLAPAQGSAIRKTATRNLTCRSESHYLGQPPAVTALASRESCARFRRQAWNSEFQLPPALPRFRRQFSFCRSPHLPRSRTHRFQKTSALLEHRLPRCFLLGINLTRALFGAHHCNVSSSFFASSLRLRGFRASAFDARRPLIHRFQDRREKRPAHEEIKQEYDDGRRHSLEKQLAELVKKFHFRLGPCWRRAPGQSDVPGYSVSPTEHTSRTAKKARDYRIHSALRQLRYLAR